MQRIHDEQNINIRFLNKDRISNSVLPSHTGALDKRKNTVILICLSPESRFFLFITIFCINFHLFKYGTRILLILINELFDSSLNFVPKMSAVFKLSFCI